MIYLDNKKALVMFHYFSVFYFMLFHISRCQYQGIQAEKSISYIMLIFQSQKAKNTLIVGWLFQYFWRIHADASAYMIIQVTQTAINHML